MGNGTYVTICHQRSTQPLLHTSTSVHMVVRYQQPLHLPPRSVHSVLTPRRLVTRLLRSPWTTRVFVSPSSSPFLTDKLRSKSYQVLHPWSLRLWRRPHVIARSRRTSSTTVTSPWRISIKLLASCVKTLWLASFPEPFAKCSEPHRALDAPWREHPLMISSNKSKMKPLSALTNKIVFWTTNRSLFAL